MARSMTPVLRLTSLICLLVALQQCYAVPSAVHDDVKVSEVDKNLTDLLNQHERGEISQEQFEFEAASLILESEDDPAFRKTDGEDDGESLTWSQRLAQNAAAVEEHDLTYLWDNCFIDEAGIININGTEDCDLVVHGVDAHADSLPGGIDGDYRLVTCFNGKPLYQRDDGPEGEDRTLWYSVMYGDWEFSYGREPSEDQLLMYGDFGHLSPLDVPDWHLAAALNSQEVNNMPSEEEDLFYIVPNVRITCWDGSQEARVAHSEPLAAEPHLAAHIASDAYAHTLEEAIGETPEDYALKKNPEVEGEGEESECDGGCGDAEEEDSGYEGSEETVDLGVFGDILEDIDERQAYEEGEEDEGGCGAEDEGDDGPDVLPAFGNPNALNTAPDVEVDLKTGTGRRVVRTGGYHAEDEDDEEGDAEGEYEEEEEVAVKDEL